MDTTEQDLRRRIEAADRARRLIDDPLLVSAFDVLDARFLLAWRNSPADQPELRERLWHHVQALAEVRAEMETALTDGILARDALDEMRAPGTETP
jgi:hypothetical protein